VSRATQDAPEFAEVGVHARDVSARDGGPPDRRALTPARLPSRAYAGAGTGIRRVFLGPQAGTSFVTNEHDLSLVLRRRDGSEFRLAPLERHETSGEARLDWDDELRAAEARYHVILEPPTEGGFWAQVIAATTAVGAAVAAAYWFLSRTGHPVWFAAALGALLVVLMVGLAVWRGTGRLARLGQFVLVLAFAFVVAIAGPLAAVWFGTGVREVFLGAYVNGTYDHPFVANELILLRATEVMFIAIASILPALLYFVYDRQRLSTQRRQFERSIMRFDPSLDRLSMLRAKYQEAMEEAFGRDSEGGRLPPGRPSPLVIATLVIMLGWGITLLGRPLGPDQAIAQVQSDPNGLVDILTPAQFPLVFGFLGAYFFTLQVIARGYARNDLRPKTYSQVTTRLLIVAVASWVIQVLFGTDRAALIAAFMVGVLPDTLFYWIREAWGELRLVVRRKATNRTAVAAAQDFDQLMEGLVEPTPLTRLDGIDLYDRFRLADEGVTTVEALAHADVPQLMLRTRIPAIQLLDWVDQAILYLHLGRSRAGREYRQERLAALGIRTATGLLCAVAEHDAAPAAVPATARRRIIANALSGPAADGAAAPSRGEALAALDVLVCALAQETWTGCLQAWHATSPDAGCELVLEGSPGGWLERLCPVEN
jgi:hypothetical protein